MADFCDLSFLTLSETLVDLVGKENLDNISVTSFTSDQKRRETVVTFRINMGSMFDEKTNNRTATVSASDDEGSHSQGVDRGLFVDEHLSDVDVA